MGMAASQARLLSLTARIHDIELQAQSIQNAKLQLATRSDQVYSEYLAALDAETLAVSYLTGTGETNVVPATFNNLCSKSRLRAADGSEYALRDRSGRLIVEDEVYKAYQAFKEQGYTMNSYAFAVYSAAEEKDRVNNFDNDSWLHSEEGVYDSLVKNNTATSRLKSLHESLEGMMKNGNDKTAGNGRFNIDKIYDKDVIAGFNEEDRKTYEDALRSYRDELYRLAAGQVMEEALSADEGDYTRDDIQDELMKEFDYYESIFSQIEACGGCRPISDYDGEIGSAATDSEWLHGMVRSGEISIDIVSCDKYGKYTLSATSASSDTSLSYRETSSIDKKALARAEAQYEHDLKEIDRKDKAYDMSLSKLDTERKALDTQRDTLTKVIQDNIERTFKIFS